VATADGPAGSGGAAVLNGLVAFVRRYIAMSREQASAAALWVAHTHALEAAEVTPYLAVTSAEKRCGKSHLFELLALLVARPWTAVSPSEAVVFRKIARDTPTLLLDEVDAIFHAKANGTAEGLRALLNAGNRRGTSVPRCVGQSQQLVDFPVFCPKALAGIGQLPDTVADRSIPIRLQRRAPEERLEPFRRRALEPQASTLRAEIEEWANTATAQLADAEPELPPELDDRAADAWEPLLAIADLAAGDWPRRARQSALALSAGREPEDDSLGVRLLADTRSVFKKGDETQLATATLIDRLTAIEEAPWASYRINAPITPRSLAGLFRPYGIRPRDLRIDDKALKGYRAEDFVDAWRRYLPTAPPAQTYPETLPAPSSRDIRDIPLSMPLPAAFASATGASLSRKGNSHVWLNHADVADVADTSNALGQPACRYPEHRAFEWVNDAGRLVCGICHPPALGALQ